MLRWLGVSVLPLLRRRVSCGIQLRSCSTSLNIVFKQKYIVKSPFEDVVLPRVSFPDYIFNKIEEFAHLTGVVSSESGHSYTYDEIRDKSLRLASGLQKLGIKKGSVVGIVSPNSPEYFIAFLAIATTGATITTVNNTYSSEEIERQLENSDTSYVICDPQHLEQVITLKKNNGAISHVIATSAAGSNERSDVLFLPDLINENAPLSRHVEIDVKEGVLVLPYSSGTTGLPKGVMLTHSNLVSNLSQVGHPEVAILQKSRGAFQELLIGVLPFFHVYGMIFQMITGFCYGSKTVIMARFTPEMYIETLARYKPTFLHTVPPIVNFLSSSPHVKPELLSSTRSMICGGAPMGDTLINRFNEKFQNGVRLIEGYGMSESSSVTHLTVKGISASGSVGQTMPNTECKLVDLESGETVGPEEGTGEICIRGPQVMKGYYKNEEATKLTIDEDNWLHTGDIAKMDVDGNIFVVDRLKELIKVKALQVAPAELENLIRSHPKVVDSVVIGIPDERCGEVPKAFVVLHKGEKLGSGELETFLEMQVAPHKRLMGGVCVIDAVPRSASGKVLRREMRSYV